MADCRRTPDRPIQADVRGLRVRFLALGFDANHRSRTAIAEQSTKVYGGDLPSEAELIHNFCISREIDRMTGGRNLEISNSDRVEWNRLKSLAEDILASKRGLDDPEIVSVREQYGTESREPGQTAE